MLNLKVAIRLGLKKKLPSKHRPGWSQSLPLNFEKFGVAEASCVQVPST